MDKVRDKEKAPRIVCVDDESAGAEIAARLADHVAADFGPRAEKPLCVIAYDGAGATIAGLNGATQWRWLYIRHLWTDAAWRGRGLAGALIDRAETRARERGCVGVYIDTFDPAVATFYTRRGFAEFGRIGDFPPGAQRIFLSKRLAGA